MQSTTQAFRVFYDLFLFKSPLYSEYVIMQFVDGQFYFNLADTCDLSRFIHIISELGLFIKSGRKWGISGVV